MSITLLAIGAVVLGLALLVLSADRFVEGAAALARLLGMSPLLIGIVIVGFGTSAPELAVSALAALEGTPAIALGNGFGSNIANIGLILGVTTLLAPITVHSQVVRRELPLLLAVTVLAAVLLLDGELSRMDGVILLVAFAGVMGWSVWQNSRSQKPDQLATEVAEELPDPTDISATRAVLLLVGGLAVLIASSRLLVWGAVELATMLGVSELVIGLTVVAIGTSLPELASSIAAVRKNEHDMALGNVLGSNLFNTLAVTGLAAVIHPIATVGEVLMRDVPVMGGMTLALFITAYSGRTISRLEGGVLLCVYVAYTVWLGVSVL